MDEGVDDSREGVIDAEAQAGSDQSQVEETGEEGTLEPDTNQSDETSPSTEMEGQRVTEDQESEKSDSEDKAEGRSEETAPSTDNARPPQRVLPSPPEEVVDSLKRLREDVGQISELSSEEGNIVDAFSLSFLKLMGSLTKSLPVDVDVLPRKLGLIDRANIIPKGELVVLLKDGRMESVDLTDQDNRDLLVTVVSNVLPRFKDLTVEKREKIEKRITFLSEITRELQNIADSVAAAG
jgi:hypothetical protein